MSDIYFVGVDVGTGSTRAALVNQKGKLIKQHVESIKTWNPLPNHYEQSSNDIWKAVCQCVRSVTDQVSKDLVKGIGFDATCSLVVLDGNANPITVSLDQAEAERNVMLWMDHRAEQETQLINNTKHELLKYVGGQVSVEMEMPKLLWLKNNLPTTWSKLWRVFDLSDFLTWRATDSDVRSLCSVVCKWNYDALKMCWNAEFLTQIGLHELCNNNNEKIGQNILLPGVPIGQGLSESAAREFNLNAGTAVSTALIDAHAGALGMFGCNAENLDVDVASKMAIIAGTSTCHMSISKDPCWTNGVWGPYKSAILSDYYLNEGGQSAAGYLLDYIIETHPQYDLLKRKFSTEKSHLYIYINKLLEELAKTRNLDDVCYLTKDLNVWPDLHGNRSPIADANLRGMICGLSMYKDEESLAILYLAFVQALAYGTRHIIENLIKHERNQFHMLLCCGGLAKNMLYVQSHADICAIPAVVPHETEMVLIGAAMLGACAAGTYDNLQQASETMGGTGKLLQPKHTTRSYHERKYKIFKQMLEDQLKYKQIMNSEA